MHSRRAALLIALLAATALAPLTSFSSAPKTPPSPTGHEKPTISIVEAVQHSVEGNWHAAHDLTFDLYTWDQRYRTVELGRDEAVAADGTRLHISAELGRGVSGTVLGAEFEGAGKAARSIAVKRIITAQPDEVLERALCECGAALADVRGGLEEGVVPCFGLVVGPNVTVDMVDEALKKLAEAGYGSFTYNVPVAVGSWSDDPSEGWNVALLETWVHGAVAGDLFASIGASAVDRLHTLEAWVHHWAFTSIEASAVDRLRAQLSGNDNWRHVPAAMVACVTRAAKHLLDHEVWHGDLKPANMLFTPDFASRPFAPENCLILDFGSAELLDGVPQMLKGSLAYVHPQLVDYHRSAAPELHHALDLFNLLASVIELVLGGFGHPLVRCMCEHQRTPALKRIASLSGLSWTMRFDIARRLAALSEDDMRGVAVASAPVCNEIGNMMADNGAICRPEAMQTRSEFIRHAQLYGWVTDAGELEHGPELGYVARLFSLTAAASRPRNREGYLAAYDEMLAELNIEQ